VGGEVPRLLEVACLGSVQGRRANKSARVVALKPNKNLTKIHEHIATHGLEIVVDGPHAFDELPRAMQYFGEGKHLGKVVITVAQPA
jgi:hypothetical protein